MRRFTEAEIVEVWDRRRAGELTRSIARRLGSSRQASPGGQTPVF